MKCFEEFQARGYVYQITDEALKGKLDSEKLVFYAGFDPTADSLHAGHLEIIMAIRFLQKAGHVPIILVGGATALIGDPSGKSEARPILTKETVGKNAESLKAQLSRFIDTSSGKAIFVNNIDWFQDVLFIDFLRDIGHRFSVNKMLAAESVKQRIESGISYLEFSYMLLQAYDFHILNRNHGCLMQLGGQDQWGNIVAGTDLVRRMSSTQAYGITSPLLLNSQGEKFGKSAGGAVWLDENRTSHFDYYQFWRNSSDEDVQRLLMLFTTLPVDEVRSLGGLKAPLINRAKEILAYEATGMAHGYDVASRVFAATVRQFGQADPEGKIPTTSSIVKALENSSGGDVPSFTLDPAKLSGDSGWIVKVLSESGLCSSGGDARRLIKSGGAYLNDVKITDMDYHLRNEDFTSGSAMLKAGKKNLRKLILS